MKRKGSAAALAVVFMLLGAGTCFAFEADTEETEGVEAVTEGDVFDAEDAPLIIGSEPVEVEAPSAVFNDLELLDNESMRFSVDCSDLDLSDGYSWTVHIVNKTAGQLVVSFQDPAFNDTMCRTEQWTSSSWLLASSSEVEGELLWSAEDLAEAGIRNPERALFTISAYEAMSGTSSIRYAADQLTEVIFEAPSETAVAAGEDETAAWQEVQTEDNAVRVTQPSLLTVDEDGYFFQILQSDQDEAGQPVWKGYIENNTDEKVMFQFSNISLDGVAVDSYWSQVVYPGMKAYPQISLWTLDMETNDITDIQDVKMTLQVWKEGDSLGAYKDPLEYDCEIEGEDAKASAGYAREDKDTDVVLIDTDEARVLMSGADENLDNGYFGMDLYLENLSDETLTYSISALDLSGAEINPYYSQMIPAGSRKNTSLLVDASVLEKSGIFAVTTARMIFNVQAADSSLLTSRELVIDVAGRSLVESKDLPIEEETEAAVTESETQTEEAAVTEAAAAEAETQTEEAAVTEAAAVTETETQTEEAAVTEAVAVTEAETQTEEAAVTEAAATEAETQTEEAAVTEAAAVPEAETQTEEAAVTEAAATEAETETEEAETAETQLPETEVETETETETEEAQTETEPAEPLEKPYQVYEDVATLRNVEAALNKLGYDIVSEGVMTTGVSNIIKRYRASAGLPEGDTIDTDLLVSLGITDAGTYKKLQEALNELGYDCGTPDGLSGGKTAQAIAAYREAEGLGESTAIDDALLRSLGLEWTKPENDNEVYKDEANVKNLQDMLIAEGYDLEKNGKLDEKTRSAIEEYRSANGLEEGRFVDDDLYESLQIVESETLRKVQQALSDAGFDCGTVDGRTGKKTTAAIDEFRKSKNLPEGGIDEALFEELGIEK